MLAEFGNYQQGILPAGPGARKLTNSSPVSTPHKTPHPRTGRKSSATTATSSTCSPNASTSCRPANYCWFTDPSGSSTPNAPKPSSANSAEPAPPNASGSTATTTEPCASSARSTPPTPHPTPRSPRDNQCHPTHPERKPHPGSDGAAAVRRDAARWQLGCQNPRPSRRRRSRRLLKQSALRAPAHRVRAAAPAVPTRRAPPRSEGNADRTAQSRTSTSSKPLSRRQTLRPINSRTSTPRRWHGWPPNTKRSCVCAAARRPEDQCCPPARHATP